MSLLNLARSKLTIAIAAAWLLPAACAFAAESGEAHFPIKLFEISGNTLISGEKAQASIQQFLGPERSFADIEQARLKLQALYEKAGYGAVQVVLPEQEITGGTIRFKVIEARVNLIDFKPTQYHDRDNVLFSLPELRQGQSPNTRDLSRSLALANESTVKQTVVTLNTGEAPGEIDAKVSVRDTKPWHAFVAAQNNGSKSSGGDWRISSGYTYGNLFNRDQVFALQAITSAQYPSDVQILGDYWKIPIPSLGDSIELSGNYANVSGNITAAGGSLAYQAAGYSAGAHYNHNFIPVGEYKHNFNIGLDYRFVQTDLNITPDYSLTPLSIAYSGNRQTQDAQTSFAVSLARNLGVASQGNTSLIAANGGQNEHYTVARIIASHGLFLKGGWDAQVSVNGQWTDEPLPGAEDFGVGGADSVRGFEERALSGDAGVRASAEITTPGLFRDGLMKDTNSTLRLAGFVDYGYIYDELAHADATISSTGLGLRIRAGEHAMIKVDAAYILDGATIEKIGPGRIHASLVWGF